jgi:hypothetical protein
MWMAVIARCLISWCVQFGGLIGDVHLDYYPHTANKCNQMYVGVVYSLGWAWCVLEHRYQKELNNASQNLVIADA